MKWSIKIAKIAGIDVKVHWTFAILLVWLGLANLIAGKPLAETATAIAFVLAIFFCVLLHEFGHALAAKRFGIRTPDITLLPIGGLARLERMPEEPIQEFLIAIAGPMVNVVIAFLLFIGIWITYGLESFGFFATITGNFWVALLLVNVALVVFNMIPAFPMDGGRVLRAILAQNMNYVTATEIAANVGQIIAIGFGIAGLFFNWFLIFIALFVYLGAQAESRAVLVRSMLDGVRVSEAMMTRFITVGSHEPVRKLVTELLAGDQVDFPVVDSGGVAGMVPKQKLFEAIASGNLDVPIHSIMLTDCQSINEDAMLKDAFEAMQQEACQSIPVERNGELIGLLSQTNIGEWLMIRSALRQNAVRPSTHQTGG